MTEKPKDYYTSKEAAELLGVAVSTIQLWTNNGLLSAWTTAGGHRRIVRQSVEALRNQQQAVSAKQKSGDVLSVVVVEDNAQQRRLYEKQFLNWQTKTNVVAAKDGYAGLMQIGRILPDVIITDLVMPRMDGFQMIRALNEQPELASSMIIVVTGLDNDEIKEKGGLPDNIHVFTKPVAFEKLEELLRQKKNINAA